MTKAQLVKMYEQWAEKHQFFVFPEELDNAVVLTSYASGHSQTEYSGTQVYAVTKHIRGKIHMFVFELRSTWPLDNDFNDNACEARETYRKIISF